MIRAVIFDLDGTLVRTEEIKALAYSQVVQRLRGEENIDQIVLNLYTQQIGLPGDTISRYLMDQLGLEETCRRVQPQYNASEPWRVLTVMRLAAYRELIADPMVLRECQWSHNVSLLRLAHSEGCLTALATSSYTDEAHLVLKSLGLSDQFNEVIGIDQVKCPKPDPEIYLLAATKLGVQAEECMVIEDSPVGVRAGLAAGMNVIAVATKLTEASLDNLGDLDPRWIVDDPYTLLEVVHQRIDEHNRSVHHHGEEPILRDGTSPPRKE